MTESHGRRDYDSDTRISVLETKTEFVNTTLASVDYELKKINENLSNHIQEEDRVIQRFTNSIDALSARVGAHSYQQAELLTTLNINNQLNKELNEKFEELHKVTDEHTKDITQAKTMASTIAKISSIIFVILGGIASALYKVWEHFK
jgi:predicted RNase H-like nuclease (RuvC/YqgF family)